MAKVTICNLAKTLKVTDTNRSLLANIQAEYVDWMHACGGKGKCTTCKAVILKGQDNLSEVSDAEMSYRAKSLLKANERLTCQTFVSGDIEISVPAECQLPHIRYLR